MLIFNKYKELRSFLLDSGDSVDKIVTSGKTFHCTVLGFLGDSWNVKLISDPSGTIWELEEFFDIFMLEDEFQVSLI